MFITWPDDILNPIDLKKTKARCPKCKSKNLLIEERSLAYQQWEQVDGVINREDGFMSHGDVIGVYGTCNHCEHRWKFKCSQITGLITD